MNPETRRVVGEECWRSVVWFGLGLFGWSLLITSTGALEASALTALGLPILTAAILGGVMVGLRLATGL